MLTVWPSFLPLRYYLNSFYPADEITLPFSLIEAAVGLANVSAAPLAASLLLLDGWAGMRGWQWLFLLEGIPSVAVGMSMAYLLPQDYQSATFLSTAEKHWLGQQLTQTRKDAHEADKVGIKRLVIEASRNSRIWLVGSAGLLKNAALVGILFWTPILVDSIMHNQDVELGVGVVGVKAAKSHASHTGVHAVLLTAIPFVTAAACAVWLGHYSQVRGEKVRLTAIPYFIAGFFLFSFPYTVSQSSVLGFIWLTAAITALTAPNAVLNSLASTVGQGPAQAISLALYNAYANLGGLLGPWLIGTIVQQTGLYTLAMQVLGVLICMSGALVWSMRKWNL